MLTSRRKLLFLLSIELLLYSLAYVPLVIAAMLAATGSSGGIASEIFVMFLLFGPTATIVLINLWLGIALVMRGVRDPGARPMMWFGLACMSAQMGVTFGMMFSIELALPWASVIALVGLAVAALMKRDPPPVPPPPAE